MTEFYQKLKNSEGAVIMGILNATPDSFSDGGIFNNVQKAVEHAVEMVKQGAWVIDLGGESTRPGSLEISSKEEIDRVLPVLKKLVELKKSENLPEFFVSIDTKKSEVVEICLQNGADLINDISGLTDKKMVEVCSRYNCPVVIMHMQGTPKDMQNKPEYSNVIEEINEFFEKQIKICRQNGIEEIILDPGIGFGKRLEDNLEVLKNLDKFNKFGYPVLLGVSRKSMFEKLFGLKVDEREEATIACNVLAVQKGVKILRVHDVQKNYRAVQMANRLVG